MNLRFVLMILLLGVAAGCRGPQPIKTFVHSDDLRFAGTDSVVSAEVERWTERRTIDDFVEAGLQNNPTVAEAIYRLESAEQQIPQELSLPDPIVATTTHLDPVETAAGQQSFGLGVSQKVVRAGRRSTQAAIAQEEVERL